MTTTVQSPPWRNSLSAAADHNPSLIAVVVDVI